VPRHPPEVARSGRARFLVLIALALGTVSASAVEIVALVPASRGSSLFRSAKFMKASLAIFATLLAVTLLRADDDLNKQFEKLRSAPIGEASEAVLAMQPVTFRYKSDKQNTPQFGLIAEEVAKVNPNLVVRDDNGQIYTVRYEAVNAMLLNEFLKAHRKVEKLECTVATQEKDFRATIAQQQKQIEARTAGLQKVTARVEADNSGQRVVQP